jgi:hypothetical protein
MMGSDHGKHQTSPPLFASPRRVTCTAPTGLGTASKLQPPQMARGESPTGPAVGVSDRK